MTGMARSLIGKMLNEGFWQVREDAGSLKRHNNNENDTDCGWAGRVDRVIGSRVAFRESRGFP